MQAAPVQQVPVDSAQAEQAFTNAVRAVFYRWTALRLAVQNAWGGGDPKEKEEELILEVLGVFGKG